MDVTSTIAAVRARCPSFSRRVFGAAEFSQLTREGVNPEALPACYIVCTDEVPENLQATENSYYQVIEARVAVVILASNVRDSRGQHGHAELEKLKEEVFGAILGWSPIKIDKNAIYEYAGYKLMLNDRAVCQGQFDFRLTYAIGSGDTRIPALLNPDVKLEKGDPDLDEIPVGEFDTVEADVDIIQQPDNKPDGIKETHFQIKGLYQNL